MMKFLERRQDAIAALMRMVLGWHLAYLGIWALTSTWQFSWVGRFRCAHWIFADFFRAVGAWSGFAVLDAAFAWGLLLAGVLLMLGRAVCAAGAFGVFYLALMYVLNPPHFGHTGESHFLYVDRNMVEICMLFFAMAGRRMGERVKA